jgi:hypothetical protein
MAPKHLGGRLYDPADKATSMFLDLHSDSRFPPPSVKHTAVDLDKNTRPPQFLQRIANMTIAIFDVALEGPSLVFFF